MLLVLAVLSLSAASEYKKLQYMGMLKDIVISTQKIRGGTFNFLNGSTAAQFIVYDERSSQKKAFRTLAYQSNRIPSVRLSSEFDNLRRQMDSLNSMAFELEPITSFSAYCILIEKMLETNQQMQKIFFENSSSMTKNITRVMVEDLLPLSEEIGRLRGLGSGIIAKSAYEDEEIAMLDESIDEIKACLKNSIHDLRSLRIKYPQLYPHGFSDKLVGLEAEISHYVQFAEMKVLGQKKISGDSDRYFADGTILIGKVMELYEVNENILLSIKSNSIGHIASTTNP
jgi:hypothetical protein